MTLPSIAKDARPGEPALSLSKGPSAKRTCPGLPWEPSPEGLGIKSEDDRSAVGAALNLGPFAPVSWPHWSHLLLFR
jgi:hypothetical protein